MPVQNKVQLITYPDSMGGDLKTLNEVLLKYFKGLFKGIHILPPYLSSGDRGFAPLTYDQIEPAFGSFDDIDRLSEKFDIVLDFMVNHLSARSIFFKDFLEKGRNSSYFDLFITPDKIWPGHAEPPKADLEKIFLRRSRPFSEFTTAEGKEETLWTTFGRENPSEQIDLDINAPATRQLIADFFENFSRHKVKMVRLDAIGYVIKKPGTSCFFVEPEIYGFIDWITELAKKMNLELLPEVHANYHTNFKLSAHGQWIYDFILPYTVLETLLTHSSQSLYNYLKIRPEKQITMLDCHDGVPIKPDLDELYLSENAKKVVDFCAENGAEFSRILSEEHKDKDGFDVHQILGTYYCLLGKNDAAYLAARAIQLFVPGVPQIYYVGLLAGENDMERANESGERRELNRHNYSIPEIEAALAKPVVQKLMRLIRFRNEYEAFDGTFWFGVDAEGTEETEKVDGTKAQGLSSERNEVCMGWKKDTTRCTLRICLDTFNTLVEYQREDGESVEWEV